VEPDAKADLRLAAGAQLDPSLMPALLRVARERVGGEAAVSDINVAATAWLVAAVALYTAGLALSGLLRAAAVTAASLLALSYLVNPQQPWAFAAQIWRAPGPALSELPTIAVVVVERLWSLLSLLLLTTR
jgi:hypothetical protein